jgi:hypothetical protein
MALIVVCLPALKPLIVRSSPTNTSNRSNGGYIQPGSSKALEHNTGGISRAHIRAGSMDDEMELTILGRDRSPSPPGTIARTGSQDAKDTVMITTHVAVTREAV